MNEAAYSILFVDDEQRMTRSLRSQFRQEYQVFTANSGQDGLDILNEHTVDVIVSDQRMPGMSGNEFLRIARTRHPHAMRILLTGYLDKLAIISTINDGEIFRFVNKPWEVDELRRIIKQAAEVSRNSPPEHSIADDDHHHRTDESDAEPPDFRSHAILLMDTDRDVSRHLTQFRQRTGVMVYRTNRLEEAATIAGLRPSLSVVILAVEDEPEPVIETCGKLKQVRPDLVTLALADMTDVEVAVKLINTGQVFRYLEKPLDAPALETVLSAAIDRHRILARSDAAQKRYHVDSRQSRLSQGLSSFFSMFTRSGISESPH